MDTNFDVPWRYREAARFLQIAETTLRKKVCAGEIPCMKPFGKRGRVLFNPQDLRALLERSRVPALAEQGKRAGRATGAVA